VLGGRAGSIRPIIRDIVNRERYQQRFPDLVSEMGGNETTARRAVRRSLAEFVVIPSQFFREVAARISRTMVSLGYETPVVCQPEQIEALRTLMQNQPVALLWTHKSHVDGTAVTATLHEQGFPLLHSFGGINMAFAGVGYCGRRSGFIFIRRSFSNDLAYKFALRQYLSFLMEQRAPFSWSFEGTRSRIGKLMPPRLGLLKYLVEAAAVTETEGLHLVPISISYDLISDVDDYAAEESGQRKSAESLGWFLSYLKRLRKPMGRIYLNIGEPVAVDAATAHRNQDNDLYKLAFRVAVNANRVTPITFPGLISMVLLGALPRAMTADELSARVIAIVDWCRARGIPLTSSYDLADKDRLESVMTLMIKRQLIACFDQGLETVYGIGDRQHSAAGYYRNTAIHFFVTKAIVELALAASMPETTPAEHAVTAILEEAKWLRNLLKHEFYFSSTAEFLEEARSELKEIDAHWENNLNSGTTSPSKLLKSATPLMAHATLLDFLYAYLIMAKLLERAERDAHRTKTEWVDMALQYGRQAYLQRTITSDASIGKQILDNAWRWFDGEGLTGNEPATRTALVETRQRIEGTIRHAETLAVSARF